MWQFKYLVRTYFSGKILAYEQQNGQFIRHNINNHICYAIIWIGLYLMF